MIVKIYLPERLYYRKTPSALYGEVAIEDKSISYFIVSDNKNNASLRLLGHVRPARNGVDVDYSVVFCYSETYPNIYLSNLNVKISDATNVNLFLYDEKKFRYFENVTDYRLEVNVGGDGGGIGDDKVYGVSDVNLLASLVKNEQKATICKVEIYSQIFFRFLARVFGVFANFCTRIRGLNRIIVSTTLFEHATCWKEFVMQRDFHSGHIWTILLDIFAGILIMIGFSYLQNPAKYFIQFSNAIILQLRTLLDSLKGSPVGLKLNVQLNNFFLDCFVYHVDLWATFLVLVSPLIYYLFLPIVVLGFFGLSFQLAMLADVIVFTSLHAQCFYIYTAVLYYVEILGFKTLWKVVLGKRRNVLKGRVESHDYMNRQLFLATLFFAVLLFLFPTVIIYYVVFAFLRTCIYFVTYTLMLIRRNILAFPIRSIVLWTIGRHLNISNVDISFLEVVNSSLQPVYVFHLNVKKSSMWSDVHRWRTDHFDKFLSINQYLLGICKGQMMGFTLPRRNAL